MHRSRPSAISKRPSFDICNSRPASFSHPITDANMPSVDDDDLTNSHDEIIARAVNLLLGRAAYETAGRMDPKDRIDYRCGARVIEKIRRQGLDKAADRVEWPAPDRGLPSPTLYSTSR
jgi:hypothetical protein